MKQDLSISFLHANLLGFIFPLAFILPLLGAYVLLWGQDELFHILLRLVQPRFALLALLWIILLTIIHEFLHGIGWSGFGRLPWNTIRFGISWSTLSPYCHCKTPISVQAYRLGGVLPGIITGLLPALVALIFNLPGPFWLGLSMILGAGGDLLSLWLIRHLPPTTRIQDHPSRVGCYVIE